MAVVAFKLLPLAPVPFKVLFGDVPVIETLELMETAPADAVVPIVTDPVLLPVLICVLKLAACVPSPLLIFVAPTTSRVTSGKFVPTPRRLLVISQNKLGLPESCLFASGKTT